MSGNGLDRPIDIAPSFRGTILGGTCSFKGIEGTVDVVTIAASTGPILLLNAHDGRTLKDKPDVEEEVPDPSATGPDDINV
jgi:hypothetical protein